MVENSEVPADAERIAVIDALRQAYALVNAQKRFLSEDRAFQVDEILQTIMLLARELKGE